MTSALAHGVRSRFASHDGDFDRRLMLPMVLGAILNPVNSSIIAVSLVPIGIAFGAPPSQTAWLVSSLYIATSIGEPVVGKLVDTFGPRRLLLGGSVLTGVAGVIGTVAPNLAVLVVARVILGFGTCAGYPAAMYLIRSESRRTGHDSPAGVLTVLAVSAQTIAVIGPTLGGLLIGLGGWRTTFALNIPLAIACFVLGRRRLPRTERDGSVPLRFDVVGIAAFAATLVSLLLLLMNVRVDMLWLLAVTVVAGVTFAVRELRTDDPFIDLRVLGGNVPLLVTYIRALLISLVSYSFLYGFTQWLEDGRGLNASQAGLVLLPIFGLGIVVSTVTGRRPEIRAKLVVGQALQIVACALLLTAQPDSPIWLLLVITAVLGIPQGLTSLATQNAVYFQADPARIAASAGLQRTFFYLGAIAASATNGAVFGASADTGGVHEIGVLTLVVAVVGLVITVFDRSLARVGTRTSGPASAPVTED